MILINYLCNKYPVEFKVLVFPFFIENYPISNIFENNLSQNIGPLSKLSEIPFTAKYELLSSLYNLKYQACLCRQYTENKRATNNEENILTCSQLYIS